MKIMIVAYDKNRAIGVGSKLPWNGDVPTDIKYFRDTTKGHPIIMGLTTYKAIGRPLPDRQNIVLTHGNETFEGVVMAHSIEEAYAAARPEGDDDIYIIGGGKVYQSAMESADRILATEIDASFPEADVFFPEFDKSVWREIRREHHEPGGSDRYAFDFVTYERQ